MIGTKSHLAGFLIGFFPILNYNINLAPYFKKGKAKKSRDRLLNT